MWLPRPLRRSFSWARAGQRTLDPPAPLLQRRPALALPHHVTGEIVSVNKSAKLFTLKTSEGATMILAADGSTLPQFSVLKNGERVKVTYKNSRGQSIATKITPA